jgi:hypothetical protein
MQTDVLIGFGDSWAWGSDLDPMTEKNYLELVAEHYNIPFINFATASSSIAHLIIQFQEFIKNTYYPKHQYHAVFFLTAKERTFLYRDQDGSVIHCSPQTAQTQHSPQEGGYYRAYNEHLGNFNANVVLLALQRLCNLYSINDYYMLGWQDISLWTTVDKTKFINNAQPITSLFHDDPGTISLQQLLDEKNQFLSAHPNQLGHEKIANMLVESIKFNIN